MKKERTITNTMKEVAVDILMDIIMANPTGLPEDFFTKIENRYNLQNDTFTKLPCTSKEYGKLNDEYNKQLMVERYGYVE